MVTRLETFKDLFDFAAGGSGLEIGPLAQPVVPAGTADIEYVDLAPRSELADFYATDPQVDTSAIPEIHYWLTDGQGGTRSLPDAVGGKRFDYVIASHVIEHVPDVIGWLAQVDEILVDDGALLLAIPDRRFTFDALRPATTVGQALQAYYTKDRIPSIRAVYDQTRSHVNVHAWDAWRGQVPTRDERLHSFDYVHAKMQRVLSGEYIDTHVWTMTPAEFLDLLEDMGHLDLLNLTVERVIATPQGLIEFYAVLRRQSRALPVEEAADERARAVEAARKTLPDEAMAPAHQVLHRKFEDKVALLERKNEKIAKLRDQTVRQRRRIRRLEAQLANAAAHGADQPAKAVMTRARNLWRRVSRSRR